MRRVHLVLAWGWLLFSIPALLWFKDSVPLLVFISIYANVAGHWSSYQATKIEVKQEENNG